MSRLLELGEQAPEFSLPDGEGKLWSPADFAGQHALLFFYPKDLTPGCTIEAGLFQKHLDGFRQLETLVFGVSKDTPQRHQKFSSTCGLTYPLLSDVDGTMIERYGVWQEKSTFGKKYMGIVRMSYLLDPEGRVAKVYPKVSTKKHTEEVLADLRRIQSC